MKVYKFDIAAHSLQARNLTRCQDLSLRRLIDLYYLTEKPLPDDLPRLCQLTGAVTDIERESVAAVLEMCFERADGSWRHPGADACIDTATRLIAKRKAAGLASGLSRQKSIRSSKNTAETTSGQTEVTDGEKNTAADDEHMFNTCSTHVRHMLNMCSGKRQEEPKNDENCRNFDENIASSDGEHQSSASKTCLPTRSLTSTIPKNEGLLVDFDSLRSQNLVYSSNSINTINTNTGILFNILDTREEKKSASENFSLVPFEPPAAPAKKPKVVRTPRSKDEVGRPDDVSETVWHDFKVLRDQKRAKITGTALNIIRSQAAQAGITLEKALETCCAQGWQGFRSSWYAGQAQARQFNDAPVESYSQRAARERAEELTPGIARKSPQQRAAAKKFFDLDELKTLTAWPIDDAQTDHQP